MNLLQKMLLLFAVCFSSYVGAWPSLWVGNSSGGLSTTALSMNTSTGVGTGLVNYDGKGLGTAWGSAFFSESDAVPEPAIIVLLGLALLCLGLLGLGIMRGRKKV